MQKEKRNARDYIVGFLVCIKGFTRTSVSTKEVHDFFMFVTEK